MKKIVAGLAVVLAAGVANAQNVPSGLTGLWRFQTSADKLNATIGANLTTSSTGNSAWFSGPWTIIDPGLSDGGVVQERSYDYLSVNPNFTANGGGSYVNQYTIMFDYVQTSDTADHYNSLFQTAYGGNDNDGDLFTVGGGVDGSDLTASTIGIGAVGYSSMTFNSLTWHRIVLSVDNGNFFRVYIDGTMYLDGAGQPVDGRFALYPDRFNLFADNDWEDGWGLVGTVATWNYALTSDQVAGMGGWIGGSATPTPLNIPEPSTLSLLALGSLVLLRRMRK
jgi:hypothetical protein